MTGPFNDPLPRSTLRLILRRLGPEDLGSFQMYRRDPSLALYQGWTAMSDTQALAFLSEMRDASFCPPGEWFQLGIAERATNRLIGDIGLCVSSCGNEAEIGFTLATEFQGRGLATEAVREVLAALVESTNVERVVGITDARNVGSIRLLERVGMHRVATMPTSFRGEPCVEQTYLFVLGR
jgi:RimJ/RimL family protein N-acetyltransferase